MVGNGNEVLGAGGEDEGFFAGSVDPDYAEGHAPRGELDGDVPETAAGAGDYYEGAGWGAGFFEGGVGCYAGAEHGLGGRWGLVFGKEGRGWGGGNWRAYGCIGGGEGVGDGGYVAGGGGKSVSIWLLIEGRDNLLHRANAILLERARGVVSANFCLGTQRIGAGHALRAVSACPRDPFDAYTVADFDAFVFAAGTELHYFAYAFVTADLAGLRGVREGGPLFV